MFMPVQETVLTYGQMNLINIFRTLWLDLAIWTRALMLSVASGMPNVEAVTNRLYRIPVEVYNYMRMIFGAEAAERIIQPLSMHIINLLSLVEAQKAGDVQAVNDITVRMYQNINDIATLFAEINPFWNQIQWRNLMFTYLMLSFEQSTALLAGDYARDIDAFDRTSYHTQVIGDYMANGIIQYLTVSPPQAN
jgi:hypothetical protein